MRPQRSDPVSCLVTFLVLLAVCMICTLTLHGVWQAIQR